MSDAPDNPEAEEPSDQPKKKKKSNPVVLILLLLFVVLLIGAMGYEYGVAKPAAKKAFEAASALDIQSSAKDVQEAIGQEPADTSDPEKTGGLTIETYSWFSVIPGRSHKFYVVYSVADGDTRLLNVIETKPRELELADE